MNSKTYTRAFCVLFTVVIISWGCKKDLSPGSNNNPPATVDTVVTIKVDSSLYTASGSGGIDTGEILLAMNTTTNGVLAILDQKGNLLKVKTLPLRTDNFQKWNINGNIRYTYLQTEGVYTEANVATEEGYDIVLDSNLNQLNRITLLPFQTVDTSGYDKLDVHEFILIGDNHYIAITDRQESPKNIPDSLHPSPQAKVIACLIQEVNNGQVVFQWDGTDYPEFYGASVENNNFSDSVNTMDYMHMNSLCIDSSDQNLICSFRNLNQIIKINRTTGAIMWRLGGAHTDFPLTADQVFLRQHYVRFTDNGQTLIFVDNGQQAIRANSRILEMHLDETAKAITSFSSYDIPDVFIQYAGSVKKFNGNYFIGGGSANYALQVNYTTNQVLLRLNQKFSSYRALKY